MGTPLKSVPLSFVQRADWLAHLGKAVLRQHHREDEGYLREVIAPDAVVIDVGAHAGQYTKLFAKLARAGRVYAIEPGAYALTILRRVVAAHRLRNVEIVPLALTDARGEAQFHLPMKRGSHFGFGLAHVGAVRSTHPVVSTVVATMTLDALVNQLGLERLDFIKADIEGGELAMLRGAQATLELLRPMLQLEVSDTLLKGAGASAAELNNFLARRGYAAMKLANGDYLFKPMTR